MMMREVVAVVGSRDWPNLALVERRLLLEKWTPFSLMISGGARGVDREAARVCRSLFIPVKEIKPDYAKHGRFLAPLKRNEQIVAECDRMIAFWYRRSRGTSHAIMCARMVGKPVEIISL